MSTKPIPPTEVVPKVADDETRADLDRLRARVNDQPGVAREMLRKFLEDYKDLTPEERKKRLAVLAGVAALTYIMADPDKKKDKPAKPTATKKPVKRRESPNKKEPDEPETEEEGADEETEEKEVVTKDSEREKRRKTKLDNARYLCINTDPAGNRRPAYLAGKSSYLLEYGLPAEPKVFYEEMCHFLAPGVEDRQKAMEKTVSILASSPMGKYQCMPRYLFGYVKDFKKQGFDWKNNSQKTEEKMKAMWEFLQSPEKQREACRGYVVSTIRNLRSDPRFNGDPRIVYASYYGGLSAGKALMAAEAAKGKTELTEEEQKAVKRVSKKQGAYISISGYAGKRSGGGSLDVETIVDRIAAKESGNLEGVKTKPRDEAWENDPRFAYNHPNKTSSEKNEDKTAPVPKINVDEFRKGNLMDALATHCPYARIESDLRRMELRDKPITIQGFPGWPEGKNTKGWNHKSAGNTKASIQKGEYKVDMVKRPKKKKVPASTHKKLEQIAIALQFDPRMPLFTGIDMIVDGIKVTMVKEIHCTPKSATSSTTIGQPHIGTAYFVRS